MTDWTPVYDALAALRQKIAEIDFTAAVANRGDIPQWEAGPARKPARTLRLRPGP